PRRKLPCSTAHCLPRCRAGRTSQTHRNRHQERRSPEGKRAYPRPVPGRLQIRLLPPGTQRLACALFSPSVATRAFTCEQLSTNFVKVRLTLHINCVQARAANPGKVQLANCAYCRLNLSNNAGDEIGVIRLAHDTDHRLGAGGPHNQPTATSKLRL